MKFDSIYPLRIDEFIPPQRRMDAFPSVRYDVPPVYQLDAIAITYAHDSAATIQIESHAAYLEPGDLIFKAPFALHCDHVMRPGGSLFNVVLRPSRVTEALPRLFLTDNPIHAFLRQCTLPGGPQFLHLRCHDLEFDREFFPEAADYCIHHADASEARMLLWENRLERLLLVLLTYPEIRAQTPELAGADAGRLSQILGYAQRHLDDVTLRAAADALGWNASHLSRYIKQHTGRSFTDIVQVLRLDEASLLLTRSDCTVEEAMARVGYTGKANFYELFHQRFGTTPAKYRRERRKGLG